MSNNNSTQAKSKRHDQVMSEAWERCRQFNDLNAIGTRVRYRSLLDTATRYDIHETETRSEAWALPGGEAVVLIKGKSGGVSLDHIEVIS